MNPPQVRICVILYAHDHVPHVSVSLLLERYKYPNDTIYFSFHCVVYLDYTRPP